MYFSKLELSAKLLNGDEALDATQKQACLSRDDLLDMLSRMSELYRLRGDTELAAEYAKLTHQVYILFESRTDALGYNGCEPIWLDETVWPRLAE